MGVFLLSGFAAASLPVAPQSVSPFLAFAVESRHARQSMPLRDFSSAAAHREVDDGRKAM
jgi:hypothetical protein